MTAPRLHDADVERIAQRVVELLREDGASGRLLTAAELAHRLGASRDYIYANAAKLGALRLPGGQGERQALRFDLAVVRERLRAPEPAPARQQRARRRSSSGGRLLPVREGTS